MPAAEPARIRPRAWAMPPQRATWSMSDAPTWTVGPSRPIDAPERSPRAVSAILPTTNLSERIWLRSSSSRKCRAAIACGMPLPCEPGKKPGSKPCAQHEANRTDNKRQHVAMTGFGIDQVGEHRLSPVGYHGEQYANHANANGAGPKHNAWPPEAARAPCRSGSPDDWISSGFAGQSHHQRLGRKQALILNGVFCDTRLRPLRTFDRLALSETAPPTGSCHRWLNRSRCR